MSTAAERKAELVAAGEVAESLTDRLLHGLLVEVIELREDFRRREERRMKEAPAPSVSKPAGSASNGSGGAVFPPYGKRKGEPVAGASMTDLEYYATGCRRTLNDWSKSRWHDKERTLLAAIESEIARQQGGSKPAPQGEVDFGGPGASDDSDIPF